MAPRTSLLTQHPSARHTQSNTLPDFGNDSDASSEESLSFTEMVRVISFATGSVRELTSTSFPLRQQNRCAIEMLRLGMGPGDIQGGASNMVDTLWGGPNHEEAQRRLHTILLPPWCAEEQGHIAEAQKSLNLVFAQRELMIGSQPLTVEPSVLAEHKAAMERIIAHYQEPWERTEGHAKGMALKQRCKVLVKMAWAAKLGCVELLKVPEWKDGKVGSSSVKRARYDA